MLEIVIEFMIEIVIEICTRCSTVAWALPMFQHSRTSYSEIAVFVARLILVDFGQSF